MSLIGDTINRKQKIKEYYIKCSSMSNLKDQIFLGFCEFLERLDKTKCILYCKKSKLIWRTTNISNHLQRDECSCVICSKERILKSNIQPESEYRKTVEVACSNYNSEFLGWAEDYHGGNTKIIQRCKEHNSIWSGTLARSLVQSKNKTSGCPLCHTKSFKDSIAKNTGKHIDEFRALGIFHEGAVFKRSERKTKSGVANYWWYYCPACNNWYESFIGSLKGGLVPCDCNSDCNYLYLLQGSDYLKFGITKNVDLRIKILNRNNNEVFSVVRLYDFSEAKISARSVETNLKATLKRFGISNAKSITEVPDGFTETIYDEDLHIFHDFMGKYTDYLITYKPTKNS